MRGSSLAYKCMTLFGFRFFVCIIKVRELEAYSFETTLSVQIFLRIFFYHQVETTSCFYSGIIKRAILELGFER